MAIFDRHDEDTSAEKSRRAEEAREAREDTDAGEARVSQDASAKSGDTSSAAFADDLREAESAAASGDPRETGELGRAESSRSAEAVMAEEEADPDPAEPSEDAAHSGLHGYISVDLSGRTAVVTGAASGIGAACAKALARSGAHVVVANLPSQDSDKTVAEILEFGGSAEVWDTDLRDHEILAEMTLDCDILVNCAGSQVISRIENYEPADWDRIIDVMLTAPFLLTRAALPHMYEEGWGRIINISSVFGLRGAEGHVAYAAAKHGLEGLTKVTAIEGGEHGVTANCVNPSFVDTPQIKKQVRQQAALNWLPEDEVLEKVLLKRNAIKELASADEVAAQVVWLCSDYARMITGASISIDGGANA